MWGEGEGAGWSVKGEGAGWSVKGEGGDLGEGVWRLGRRRTKDWREHHLVSVGFRCCSELARGSCF